MGLEVKNDIDVGLKRMAAQNKRVLNKALRSAGEALADRLQTKTPYEPKTKLHLRDNIVVGNPDPNGNIKIGYDKKVAWRAHFVELGTIYQKPQAMIQRTEEEMKDQVMSIMKAELKKGLGLE